MSLNEVEARLVCTKCGGLTRYKIYRVPTKSEGVFENQTVEVNTCPTEDPNCRKQQLTRQ